MTSFFFEAFFYSTVMKMFTPFLWDQYNPTWNFYQVGTGSFTGSIFLNGRSTYPPNVPLQK